MRQVLICRYNARMTAKLSEEMREALRQTGSSVDVLDEQSHKLYVLTERDVFVRAMRALQAQEDYAAIKQGIAAVEAGNVLTLEELDKRIRSRLSYPGGT